MQWFIRSSSYIVHKTCVKITVWGGIFDLIVHMHRSVWLWDGKWSKAPYAPSLKCYTSMTTPQEIPTIWINPIIMWQVKHLNKYTPTRVEVASLYAATSSSVCLGLCWGKLSKWWRIGQRHAATLGSFSCVYVNLCFHLTWMCVYLSWR